MKTLIIVGVLILILWNLGAGLDYMLVDKGESKRTVNALTKRVALSVALILGIVALAFAWLAGWIGRDRLTSAASGRIEDVLSAVAGFQQTGIIIIDIKKFDRCSAYYIPAARGIERVYPCLLSGDANRSGGYL